MKVSGTTTGPRVVNRIDQRPMASTHPKALQCVHSTCAMPQTSQVRRSMHNHAHEHRLPTAPHRSNCSPSRQRQHIMMPWVSPARQTAHRRRPRSPDSQPEWHSWYSRIGSISESPHPAPTTQPKPQTMRAGTPSRLSTLPPIGLRPDHSTHSSRASAHTTAGQVDPYRHLEHSHRYLEATVPQCGVYAPAAQAPYVDSAQLAAQTDSRPHPGPHPGTPSPRPIGRRPGHTEYY